MGSFKGGCHSNLNLPLVAHPIKRTPASSSILVYRVCNFAMRLRSRADGFKLSADPV